MIKDGITLLNKKITQVNTLSAIFFGLIISFIVSIILISPPSYIILENRVMYDRIYDFNDQIKGKGFDLLITMMSIAFLSVLFVKRWRLMAMFLSGYSALVILLLIYHIPIHNSNVLVTPLLLLTLFIYNKSLFKSTVSRSQNFFYMGLFILAIICLLYNFLSIYGMFPIQERPINSPVILFFLASQYTPYLFILLFFLASCHIILKIFKFSSLSYRLSKVKTPHASGGIKRISLSIMISGIIIASILVPLIPHLPSVNPEGRFVGYDSGYYITWINEIDKGKNIVEVLSIALYQSSGDRFLSLLIIFGFHWLTNVNIEDLIEYLPLILSPLLAFVTYLLTYEISRNIRLSLLASLLTPFSIQVSMGIYSGYYSNWIALIIAYTSTIFFIKCCKYNNISHVIILGLCLTTLSLTHIYTWVFFVVCIGIALVLIVKYKIPRIMRNRGLIILTTLIISSSGFVIPWLSSGNLTGLHNFMDLYNNDFDEFKMEFVTLFNFVILVSHGGLFSNIMIPFLSLVFMFTFQKQSHNIYFYCIAVLVSLTTLTIFLGGIEFKTRILYDIPFQITAAYGLLALYEYTRNKILLLGSFLSIVAYSLYALTNFYLVPPEVMYPQDYSN